jgi:type II secretory pathway component PulM
MAKMSNREKGAVIVGGVSLLAFILYLAVITPIQNKIADARERIQKNQKNLDTEVVRLADEFQNLQQQVNSIESRMRGTKDDSLAKTIDELTRQQGIAEKVDKIEQKGNPANDYYKEELLDLNLKNITPGELVKLLVSLESQRNLIVIKRLHAKTDKLNRDQLREVKLSISSLIKL